MAARNAVMIVFLTVIFLGFLVRLIQVQIVDIDNYRLLQEATYTRTMAISPTRGEIYDRNGVPLVKNRVSYQIVLDKAYIRNVDLNRVILHLTELLTQTGETWTDKLPISQTEPYTFTDDATAVARLKKFLELQPHATAENCMEWLAETYKLQNFTSSQIRLIAGVRYTMSDFGYSLTTPYSFAENISYATSLIIEENADLYLGAYVEESPEREYVCGDLAANIIGITGKLNSEEYDAYKENGYGLNDRIGKFGIERQFEAQLRGTAGTREIRLDSRGEILSVEDTVLPQAGESIYLTIDSELQRVAQTALAEQIAVIRQKASRYGYEAKGGAAVAVAVKTGEILACANYPTYDLSRYYADYQVYAQDPLSPLYNRALSGLYAPGSCFKPVTAVSALTAGVVTDTENIFCAKKFTHFSDYQPSCMYYHGNINLTRALSVSCNVYFFETGLRAGVDRIVRYAKQFGLGESTGIEISEKTGRVASPAVREALGGKWQAGDILQLAIGQSDSQFSPLQIAMYTATLANNGTRMSAHIVNRRTTYDGSQTLFVTQPTVASQVDAASAVFESVKKGMVTASLSGTGRSQFANYPVKVASKTGTPEIGDGTCDAVFIAYAPADDPEIAVAIVIERGYQGYEAAPVAKAIFDRYFGYDVTYSFDTANADVSDIME